MASCFLLQSVFGDLHHKPQSVDEDILRTALHDATADTPWNFGMSDCLLTGVGDRVVLLVELTLKICDLALGAERLKEYLAAVVDSHQSDDFATFRPLNKKHKVLREIVTQLRYILQMHQETWRTEVLVGTSLLPSLSIVEEIELDADDIEDTDDLDSLDMDNDDREGTFVSRDHQSSSGPSVQVDGEPQKKDRQRSGQIKATCEHGFDCKKGGVDKQNGSLVVFVQQSAFQKHMNKHNKPFSCRAPNCGRSFTRPDHLDRHMQKKHRDPD